MLYNCLFIVHSQLPKITRRWPRFFSIWFWLTANPSIYDIKWFVDNNIKTCEKRLMLFAHCSFLPLISPCILFTQNKYTAKFKKTSMLTIATDQIDRRLELTHSRFSYYSSANICRLQRRRSNHIELEWIPVSLCWKLTVRRPLREVFAVSTCIDIERLYNI